MAGVGGEPGRKLRARGLPAPPVTRLAAAASNNATVARQVEVSRLAKLAPKRAAIDDNNRTAIAAPPQHAKKRAALANLTNYSNTSFPRNIVQVSKSQVSVQVKIKGRAVATQSREVEVNQVILESKSEANSPTTFQNDENVFSGTATGPLGMVKSEIPSTVCNETKTLAYLDGRGRTQTKTLASLDGRGRTQHNFLVSKDPKPRARQGYLFEEYVEGEGWSCKNYTDIDNNKDPQMCCSYAPDIYFHLCMAELKRRPARNFMEAVQQDINASMRGILVDWLVEVAEEYKLVPDTLYLTVAYIDRFLSGNVVNRQRLQLLGVSCMLIASKYEEICAPQVDEFCYITDNTYGREEVLEMEKRVLNHLQFQLAGPTTKTFLRRFIWAAQAGQKISTLQLEFLGNYLAELTLVEYGFLQYLPSMIAGSAVFLAKVTLDPSTKPWNPTLQHYSGYKPSELKECVKAIHDLQCNKKNCTLPAVREKYKQHKFKSVATLLPPAFIPLKYFEDLDDAIL